ncbi:MAG: type II toxin-antitoxin system VapB family antitoxin [Bryobacterales bacterium]|nr:type II toxin-antitoxin system VapB family antitoxin [Acidobacteriota bacterium]MCB9384711.1 type II toxin-antitoxin system VapB family antitoxin [Bryobacterales bacterium]
MALVIDNAETERLVAELARATGHSPAEALADLIRERLREKGAVEPALDPPDIWEQIREIQDRVAAMPDVDSRGADEIIGYDEHGVPR